MNQLYYEVRSPVLRTTSFDFVHGIMKVKEDIFTLHFKRFMPNMKNIPIDESGNIKLWTKAGIANYINMPCKPTTDWAELTDFNVDEIHSWLTSGDNERMSVCSVVAYTRVLKSLDPFRVKTRNKNRNLRRKEDGKPYWDNASGKMIYPNKPKPVKSKKTDISSSSSNDMTVLPPKQSKPKSDSVIAAKIKMYKKANKGKDLTKRQMADIVKMNGGPLDQAKGSLIYSLKQNYLRWWTPNQKVLETANQVEVTLFLTSMAMNVTNAKHMITGLLASLIQACCYFEIDIIVFAKMIKQLFKSVTETLFNGSVEVAKSATSDFTKLMDGYFDVEFSSFDVVEKGIQFAGMVICGFCLTLTGEPINFTSLVRHFAKLSGVVLSAKVLVEMVQSFLVPRVYKSITGYSYEEARFCRMMPEVYLWCLRVSTMYRIEEDVLRTVKSVQLALRDLDKKRTAVESIMNLSKNRNILGFKDMVTMSKTLLKEMLAITKKHNVIEGSAKPYPVGVYISGATGVGKSTLVDNLFDFTMVRFHPDKAAEKTSYMYKSTENEFKDGYRNQVKFFVIDDIGQLVQNRGAGTWASEGELYNLFSTMRTPVNMADLSDKGNVFLSPEHVVATSNEEVMQKKGILKCPESAQRRWNTCYAITPKEDFAKDSTTGIKLDYDKYKQVRTYYDWNLEIKNLKNASKCMTCGQCEQCIAIDNLKTVFPRHQLDCFEWVLYDSVQNSNRQLVNWNVVEAKWIEEYTKHKEDFHKANLETERRAAENNLVVRSFNKWYTRWEEVDKITAESRDINDAGSFALSFKKNLEDIFENVKIENDERTHEFAPLAENVWLASKVKVILENPPTLKKNLFLGGLLCTALPSIAYAIYKFTLPKCPVSFPDSVKDWQQYVDHGYSCHPSCDKCKNMMDDIHFRKMLARLHTTSIVVIDEQACSNRESKILNDIRNVKSAKVDPKEVSVAKAHGFIRKHEEDAATLNNNVYFFSNNKYILGCITFVDSKHFLCLKHFLHNNKEGFKLIRYTDLNYEILLTEKDFDVIELTDDKHDREVVLCKLKKSAVSHKTLIKRFVSESELPLVQNGLVTLSNVYKDKDNRQYCIHKNSQGNPAIDFKVFEFEGKSYTEYRSVICNMHVEAGDCGGLLMSQHKSIAGKYIGPLFAGGEVTSSIALVTREMLQAAIDEPLYLEEDSLALSGLKPGYNEFCESIPGMNILGNCTPNYISNKTSLRRSAISDTIHEQIPLTTRPAKMLHKDALASLRKFARVKSEIPEGILNEIYDEMWTKFIGGTPRLLTREEAIWGNESMCPINRTTAPGWPLSEIAKAPGKKSFLAAQGDLEPEFQHIFDKNVNDMLETCKKGIVPTVVFVISYKDEALPKAKVDAGKQRIISTGPMEYTYCFRQYFGSFMMWVCENNITNDVSLAMSDAEHDIDRMRRHIDKFKDGSFGDGDYSAFEASMSAITGDKMIEFINRWYNQNEINHSDNLVRKCLWEASNRPLFKYRGNMIQSPGGNPSGWPGTALKNNLDNLVKLRYCFKLLAPGYNFNDHIGVIVGGDDHVWSVSPEVKHLFKPTLIQEQMKEIGMVWTPAHKDDEVLDTIPFDQLVFLGRNMSGHLRDESIEKMLHWVRNGDVVHFTQININTACREESRKGRHKYNVFADKVARACVAAGLPATCVPTFDQVTASRIGDELITRLG